ncbi:MAG: hypothetical protein ACP5LF_00420 [Nitrososphaeria archaeon]
MSVPNKNEVKSLIKQIIENSCITELEFLSLINQKSGRFQNESSNISNNYIKFLKKSSGERSTIKRRARQNVKSCFMTLILFMSLNLITDKNLIQLKEISDMITRIINVENEELYKKLDELLETMIKELF